MRRVTGAEVIESYREQLEAGTMMVRAVAAAIGVTPEYIYQLCKKLGIAFVRVKRGPKPRPKLPRKPKPRPPLGMAAQRITTYREQLEQGQLTMDTIGKEIGISRERVRQLCKKLEIKPIQPRSCRNRKCSAVLRSEERESHFCHDCKPRQKVRIAWCAQCEQPYAMTGEKRVAYIRNHKNGVKDSRCPDCLKAASQKYERIMVQCLDCGANVERMRLSYYQNQQRGINGPVCAECRGKRTAKHHAAKALSLAR